MKAGKQKQLSLEVRERKLRSIESDLHSLAVKLERDLSRSTEGVKSREHRLAELDLRVSEYQMQAGSLLDNAVELGGFGGYGSLRRLVSSQRGKFNPNWGYKSAFELACWKWIPRQPDGFDFEWKRKQIGEVKTYILALRFLAGCLGKSLKNEDEQDACVDG